MNFEYESTNVDWSLIPVHMRSFVKDYIEQGNLGYDSDFLRALLSNKLRESFYLADDINVLRIYDYVKFLYKYAPANCWGSKENMTEWNKIGGIHGIKKADKSQLLRM